MPTPSIVLGRYELLSALPTVDGWICHRATDRQLASIVRIRQRRFRSDLSRHELDATKQVLVRATRLEHSHLERVLDFFVDGDAEQGEARVFVIVTDDRDSDTAERTTSARSPLPSGTIIEAGVALAGAVEAAHNEGLVWGGIQPQDVLLSRRDGFPVLTIVGLVRQCGAATPPERSPDAVYQEEQRFRRLDCLSLLDRLRSIANGDGGPVLEGTPQLLAVLESLASELPDRNPAGWLRARLREVASTSRDKSFDDSTRLDLTHSRQDAAETRLDFRIPEEPPLSRREEYLAPIDENVQFTVYRPTVVLPGVPSSVLAFAHLSERRPDAPPDEPHPLDEVKRQADLLLGSAAPHTSVTADSGSAIPREGDITFVLNLPGFDVNPPSRSFRWSESVHREEFRIRASDAVARSTVRGQIRVFLGSVIVAEIALVIRVAERGAVAGATAARQEAAYAPIYRKIFASYSHKDLQIVEHIEAVASALALEFLRDVKQLRVGERWSPRILDLIREADVFQLFWSRNSMYSPEVRKEWEFALSLNRPGFILPTYWEEPRPSDEPKGLPPPAIQALHFQKLPSANGLTRSRRREPSARPVTAASKRTPSGGTTGQPTETHSGRAKARWGVSLAAIAVAAPALAVVGLVTGDWIEDMAYARLTQDLVYARPPAALDWAGVAGAAGGGSGIASASAGHPSDSLHATEPRASEPDPRHSPASSPPSGVPGASAGSRFDILLEESLAATIAQQGFCQSYCEAILERVRWDEATALLLHRDVTLEITHLIDTRIREVLFPLVHMDLLPQFNAVFLERFWFSPGALIEMAGEAAAAPSFLGGEPWPTNTARARFMLYSNPPSITGVVVSGAGMELDLSVMAAIASALLKERPRVVLQVEEIWSQEDDSELVVLAQAWLAPSPGRSGPAERGGIFRVALGRMEGKWQVVDTDWKEIDEP